ncbi:MAG: CoA transferase [Dehalococcoidia bacterium]|nr:CoA transferase [Dehalococcoidia bacterium]MDW8120514.1 CoA transferase [Chloroflexota bacterium]
MALGPLHGIRVVEHTHMYAGPYCCALLGDLGADVIKLEPVERGDRIRELPPFTPEGRFSYPFGVRNRNKRSLAVDLATPEGQAIAHRLVATADVFVHNIRPQTLERLGLSYARLREINPRLIFAGISGFGQHGPFKDLPGQDLQIQAMSGILSVTGYPDLPSTPIGDHIGDASGGVITALAILAALYHRERTGQGQEVHVSLLASLMALQHDRFSIFLNTGIVPPKRGMGSPVSPPPYGIWRCRDGQELALSSSRDDQWADFCTAIERPDLAQDARFATREQREAHRSLLAAILREVFLQKDRDTWVALLRRYNQWVVPVRDYAHIVADGDLQANGRIVETVHPQAGRIRALAFPADLHESPATVRRPAPLLGEHTRELLRELGYTNEEVDALYQRKVVR